MESNHPSQLNRRQFLLRSTITAGGIIATNLVSKSQLFAQAPAIITSDKMRPAIPYGVASGDISKDSIVIWSRSDRPAKMIVEYSTSESFKNVRRVMGPNALKNSDFTARLYLRNLPPDQKLFYRVIFQDLDYKGTYSAPVKGTFSTPPNLGEIYSLCGVVTLLVKDGGLILISVG